MGQPIKKTDRDKPWAKRQMAHCKEARLAEFKKILIITQDAESSKIYFTEWKSRLHGASTLVKVEHAVKDPMQIVTMLENRRKQVECDVARAKNVPKFSFDEVWVAFDKDSFQNFDDAVAVLRGMCDRGYREAWTNECFELWYVLHFRTVDASSAIGRQDLFSECSGLLRVADYADHGKGHADIHRAMANRPIEEIRRAIDNANVLEQAQAIKNASNIPPSRLNPMTTVHHLIGEFVTMMLPDEASGNASGFRGDGSMGV